MTPLVLRTPRLLLRPGTAADLAPLCRILGEPEVARFWPGFDEARVRAELCAPDEEVVVLVIEHDAEAAGAIQLSEETDPQYRHAGIDLFLGARWQGRGLGAEAIRAVVEHLLARGHHRLVIDPALHNTRAVRCYASVGFRPVGVMRAYERGADGTFHDGLLMELLAGEYRPAAPPAAAPPLAAPGVRPAAPADVPALLPMMEDFNRLEGIAWDRRTGEAPLRTLVGRPDLGLVGVVGEGEEIVGYFVLTWGYDLEWGGRDAFLTELYLRPAARGRGLGAAVMREAEALARGAGAGALHLMVRDENAAALRLYLAAGYAPPGRLFLSKPLGERS
jgi:aminoglycoside 6'-N-acetyltransferase